MSQVSPDNFTSLLAINLKSCFLIYLVDLHGGKKSVDLRAQMNSEMLTSTRQSHVFSISLCREVGVFVVATTNHNFMCFDQRNGLQVRVKSDALFYQSVTPNRKLFLQNIFGEQSHSIPEIFQVSLTCLSEIEDFLIGEFVLFDGSTLTRLSMDVDRAVEEGEGLGFDFLEYTDKYPYLIDRN